MVDLQPFPYRPCDPEPRDFVLNERRSREPAECAVYGRSPDGAYVWIGRGNPFLRNWDEKIHGSVRAYAQIVIAGPSDTAGTYLEALRRRAPGDWCIVSDQKMETPGWVSDREFRSIVFKRPLQ